MNSVLRNYFILSSHLLLVAHALPSGWRVCDKEDPERNKCLAEAINGAVQSMMHGNKELGIEPLDPLHFGRIFTKGSEDGPVALELLMTDFVIHNSKNYIITSAELVDRTLKLRAHNREEMLAESPYRMSGTLFNESLSAEGHSKFTFVNGNYTFDLTFRKEPEVRKGKRYLVVEKFVYHGYLEKLGFEFDNLFKEDKQRGENVNKVINENWELVRLELKPLFQEAISKGFLNLSNKIFSLIPMDEIGLF